MTTRPRSKLSWRWMTCAATAVAAMAFPAEAQPVSYDGWKVVTVQAATPSALQTLEAIPHEALYGHGGIGRNIVLVSPSSAQALAVSGLPYTVDVNNYQDYLDDVATRRAMYESVPAQQPPIYMTNPFTGVPSGNIGVITQALDGPPPVIESAWYWTWHTQEEVFDKLKALRDTYAAATDLDLEVFSLGTTFEGREIPTLRITGPVQQGQRPALYLRAGIHAAEQVGVLASLYMVEAMLSTYANGDQRMIELVKNVEIYLTPLQNPDGYAFFRESGNLSVRKNRHDYRDTANDCTPETVQSVGVELNRNWDIEWCKYESMDKCRRDYCGPSPMSELEVQAMADFMLRTPNLAANIDIHAFSQLVLIPWAHTYDDSNPQAEDRPHKAVYEQLQREVISEINAVHSATYGDEVGYALGGGSTDWTQAQGLWSLAYEVRPLLLADNYPDDFEPENSEQYPTAVWTGEELLQGTLHFAEFLVADLDQDGVINGFDNCPDVQNFTQRDCDGNHIGDACDDVTPRCSSDAVIVLDRSGSMAERDGASGASRGAHALSGFGAYLYNSFFTPGTNRAAVVGFAASPQCLAYADGATCDFVDVRKDVGDPSQDATSIDTSFALDALNQTSDSYNADGKTDILEAVEFGVSNFAHAPDVAARKYLYLLSDGQQTEPFSQSRYDALMSSIRDEHPNLTISALAVTPEADMEELLSYTAPTGGAIGYAEEANGAPVYWHDVEAQNIRELAVLAGPDKITTPADLIIQEASTNGSIDFEVSLDATALSVVLSSRTSSWNLRLALVDRLGNRYTPASHPQRFSKPSYDDTLLMVNLPNPTDGRWTMVTGDPVEQSSNFIITEVNPVASLELDGDMHVIRSGQAAQLTPEIEYRGVPLDVNTANCSVVKATVPGGRTLYANELPAASIVLSNTSDRVAAGLPPRLQVTPFAGRGYYTVQVRCAVTASARARPPAQLNGVVRSFTHNASFTVFADVPQMPACTSADCDGDGVPNSQEGSGDSDRDGWLDSYDSDADNDDFGDARDTCPTVANPEQRPNLPGVVLTTTNMQLSSCAAPFVSTMLTRPTVAVGCVDPATVTLTAALISVNGRALPSPQPIDPANVTLPVGTSIVGWTGIASFGATGSAQQTITIGVSESAAACCAGKTVVQGTALPDLLLRPQDGQFCMFGQGSFDLLLGGPGADGMFGGDGLDKITSGDAGSVVSGGPGADVLTTLAGSTYGGAGGDVIEMSGGGALYGNEGDDDIVSVLANHHIYPGPGRDVVLAGLGDDHVYVYDACELAALEVLDGGLGNDTLHIPLPLLDVLGRGVIVLNFENIVVETNNRHLSECFP